MASKGPRITMLLAAAIAIIFLASIVLGYSGFGFSILAIAALILFYFASPAGNIVGRATLVYYHRNKRRCRRCILRKPRGHG
jgi:uncharacterized membrane protein YfcA